MALPYLVRFVDRIAASPTVRLDIMRVWSVRPESDLSPPPRRRAIAGTLLADGQIVPAAAWDNRTIRLELRLRSGVDENVAAAALQQLARELDRPGNVLLWQPGTSNPVFFRTLRAEFGAVRWNPLDKTAQVLIPAEPFGYGIKVDLGAPMDANPFFETDLSDWVGMSGASIARVNLNAHEGSWSLRITPPGGVAAVGATTIAKYPVLPGTPYVASAWIFSPAGWTDMRACIDWYDAAGAFITTGLGSATVVPAATPTQSVQTLTSPSNAAFAFLRARQGGTPAATDVSYWDELTLRQSFVINNDPAAATTGMFLDVAGSSIIGDVETPLFLKVGASSVVTSGRRQSAVGVRRRGVPSVVPLVWQMEASSLFTDTTLQANDAAMSGSGQNYLRCSFATTTSLVTRAGWSTWPAAPSVDNRGTYRAFLRCRKNTAGPSTVLVALGASLSGVAVNSGTVEVTNTVLRWVDLGLIQIPIGADPSTDGYSGTQLPVAGMDWRIYGQLGSGSATLDLDALVLIPADDRLALIKWPDASTATSFICDGARSQVYAVGANGEVQGVQPIELAGALPIVTPSQDTRLVWMQDVGQTSISSDSKTATTTVTPYYWPRYLYVRGAA